MNKSMAIPERISKSKFEYFWMWISIFLYAFGFSPGALAEKMSLEAHDLVIEKLESSLKVFGNNDQNVDSGGLKLQLANLYSEKARLLLVEEGHRGCQNCLDSIAFREKSIALYRKILPQLAGLQRSEVSLQLAYLLESRNLTKESLKIYNQLIADKTTDQKSKAQAYAKRASLLFQKGDFDKALADFEMASKLSPSDEKGSYLHKIAWIYFNKGEVDRSIKTLYVILKNEDLLKQATEDGWQYSEGFHSEVVRDLATFMAKDRITESSLEQFVAVNLPNEVSINLLFLGDEAERVGQPDGAVMAWEYALTTEGLSNEKKFPLILRIARHHRDNHRYQNANRYFAQVLQLARTQNGSKLGASGCENSCAEQTKDLKQFLAQWEKSTLKLTKVEKKRESQLNLLKAYELYHSTINSDFETHLWQGQLAIKLKQSDLGRRSFSRAADLIAKMNLKNKNSSVPLLNSALLAEIELAEEQANPETKMEAYNHYLELLPKGPASDNVRYQQAKVLYDQSQIKKAFELFDGILEDQSFKNSDLKLKSANLALDSLVLLKDIEKLEKKSLEYSQIFPKEANQFHQISRKAGLQIVTTLATKDASVSSAEAALLKLETVTLKATQKDEYRNYLKMKIDLALKAQRWQTAQVTLGQFIRLPGLSESDRTWALGKKLALAELLLDFKQAYQIILQMGYSKSTRLEELVKGALLAELAKENVVPWLERVIRAPKVSQKQATSARAKLIKLSRSPWKTLHTQARMMTSQPSIFADTALDCFAKDPNLSEALWALDQHGVKTTWAGRALQRSIDLNSLRSLSSRIRAQRLNSRNDMLLASSLKNRIKDLAEIKSQFVLAQKKDEWIIAIVAASNLKIENERLAKEIEGLPIPRKLKATEKQLYQNELFKQAIPFKKTSEELAQFLEQAWKHSPYLELFIQQIESSDSTRNVLLSQLKTLMAVAPSSVARDLNSRLTDLGDKPSNTDIISTQAQLRRDPFDLQLQERLLLMEKKRGNQSMVVFLQARGTSLKGGQL